MSYFNYRPSYLELTTGTTRIVWPGGSPAQMAELQSATQVLEETTRRTQLLEERLERYQKQIAVFEQLLNGTLRTLQEQVTPIFGEALCALLIFLQEHREEDEQPQQIARLHRLVRSLRGLYCTPIEEESIEAALSILDDPSDYDKENLQSVIQDLGTFMRSQILSLHLGYREERSW